MYIQYYEFAFHKTLATLQSIIGATLPDQYSSLKLHRKPGVAVSQRLLELHITHTSSHL